VNDGDGTSPQRGGLELSGADMNRMIRPWVPVSNKHKEFQAGSSTDLHLKNTPSHVVAGTSTVHVCCKSVCMRPVSLCCVHRQLVNAIDATYNNDPACYDVQQ
jgi:hypothetical protein